MSFAVPLKYENVGNELRCCYRKRFAPQHLPYAVPFFVFYVFAVFQQYKIATLTNDLSRHTTYVALNVHYVSTHEHNDLL